MRTSLPLAALLCATSIQAQVVINEVDYDQSGTDDAEYLEIKNVGSSDFPLQYLRVVLINGNNGGAAEYRTIESGSWPALAPGDYFVICASPGLTLNCDHTASPATNLIQNGPTDAIALVSTVSETVYDVLSYGGDVPGYTEGTGTTAEDTNDQDGLSLSRWPDGLDTNDNDADFVIGCPTPGGANELDPVNCVITTGVRPVGLPVGVVVVPDVHARRIDLSIQQGTAQPLSVQVYAANGALLHSRDLGTNASATWSIPCSSAPQLLFFRIQVGDTVIPRTVLMP